jgi:hypothetical protein
VGGLLGLVFGLTAFVLVRAILTRVNRENDQDLG